MAIQTNQIVSIEYEVKDNQTNDIVDNNIGGAPLVFMYGKGQIIPGLESELVQMSIGDNSNILVTSKDAYGEYNDEAMQEVPKDQFAGIDLAVGMTLYGQGEDSSTAQVIVKELKNDTVILDFNHPLAGKDLMFNVTVSNIRDASEEELATGIPIENSEDACCSSTGDDSGCGCH